MTHLGRREQLGTHYKGLKMLGLLESGVFIESMGTRLYLSLAHDEEVRDEFAARLTDVIAAL